MAKSFAMRASRSELELAPGTAISIRRFAANAPATRARLLSAPATCRAACSTRCSASSVSRMTDSWRTVWTCLRHCCAKPRGVTVEMPAWFLIYLSEETNFSIRELRAWMGDYRPHCGLSARNLTIEQLPLHGLCGSRWYDGQLRRRSRRRSLSSLRCARVMSPRVLFFLRMRFVGRAVLCTCE